jgi:hypothetical protein
LRKDALRERHLLKITEEVALENGRGRKNAARSVYYHLLDFVRTSQTFIHIRSLEWLEGAQAFRNEFLLECFDDYAILRSETL